MFLSRYVSGQDVKCCPIGNNFVLSERFPTKLGTLTANCFKFIGAMYCLSKYFLNGVIKPVPLLFDHPSYRLNCHLCTLDIYVS